MTMKQLSIKEFAGSMCHPVCEIVGCFNENLHDVILTKDGGIYLICERCRQEYFAIMQKANIEKYRKLRDQGIPPEQMT